MKYSVENLTGIQKVNNEIKNLSCDLDEFLNRAVTVREDLEETERILLTPQRDVSDILRHADLIKEFGEVFHNQLETVNIMNRLLNKIYKRLQNDYDVTVKAIKS